MGREKLVLRCIDTEGIGNAKLLTKYGIYKGYEDGEGFVVVIDNEGDECRFSLNRFEILKEPKRMLPKFLVNSPVVAREKWWPKQDVFTYVNAIVRPKNSEEGFQYVLAYGKTVDEDELEYPTNEEMGIFY